MPALKHKLREDFAQAVAQGIKAPDAYAASHPTASRKTCSEAASRLTRHGKVAARIAELEALKSRVIAKAEEKVVEKAATKLAGKLLTMQDRRAIMGEIAMDAEIEADTRMRAVMNDAKLAGELIDKQDLTTDGEALPSVMPSISLQLPTAFLARRGSSTN